jgi:hypothetical protein
LPQGWRYSAPALRWYGIDEVTGFAALSPSYAVASVILDIRRVR